LESRSEIDAFFDNADPEYVGFALDTGHVMAGGSDPVAIARDYASVISYVHAKDLSQDATAKALADGDSRGRYLAFRDPGEGDVDFGGIFAALAAAGFTGPILAENDLSPDPEDAMRRADKYLRSALAVFNTGR
jgi:inosose dehydratase